MEVTTDTQATGDDQDAGRESEALEFRYGCSPFDQYRFVFTHNVLTGLISEIETHAK